ncbi:MAG: YXWGXW repeat-containing protein [Akkermansia sp.]|nr:YXWGXW repeat-containing protein [Akkermansia sp.]
MIRRIRVRFLWIAGRWRRRFAMVGSW